MGVAGTIAKNTLFNFVATASDLLVTFVVGIVLARSLGTEQYGLYALLMSFLAFASLAASLGLGSMAMRFIAEGVGRHNRDEAKGLARLSLVLRGAVALIAFLVILAFSGFWAKVFAKPGDQIYFVLLAFILLPNVLNYAFISIFAGFQKYEYIAYLSLGTSPLRAILVTALAFWGFGIRELLLANMAAWVIGMLIGVFLLHRLIPLKALLRPSPLNPAIKTSALKYALIMSGVLVTSYFLWGQAEVLILGLYRPAEEVGFYTLGCKSPSMSMALIPSVLGAVLLPAIAEQFGKGDTEKLKAIYVTSARYLMLLAMPMAAAGIALAKPIVNTLYGADYAPVIILMQIMFIPFAVSPVVQGATVTLEGIKQPAFLFKAGAFLGCLNIGLNFWLIPRYGVLGAAIASSVSRSLSLIPYISFASRKIGVAWPLGDAAKIALASGIMGLALFGLQIHLNAALSLALGIPLGLVLYAVAILVLKVVHRQDLDILKGIQGSLPSALRKHYAVFVGVAERLAGTKPASG
jgi:O-antigen/teichoic acid export membrane protein